MTSSRDHQFSITQFRIFRLFLNHWGTYSKRINWLALVKNTDHRLILLVIGIYQLCKYLNEGTLFCLKKWAKRIGISDRGVSKLVIRSHEFTTINQTFSFSRLDPFKQNKVSTYSVSKTNAGLKLMCTKWRNFQRISFYIHFWQMTTVVSTCLEKWEFLKFVIIWKAETWLQTQKSEHCTSLHCTALHYSATGISDLHQGKTSTVRSSPLTTIVTPHLFYGLLVTMNKMNKMN